MKIAVIGLGAMGYQMCSWLNNDFTVTGYDIATEKMEMAAQEGIATAPSAREAVTDTDIVLVAVRNSAQLNDLLYGEGGIASAMRPGSCLLLTSTIGIEAVETVAARLKADGIGLIDAPVSGGPARAGKGDLLVVVGAVEEEYNFAKPVLDAMSSTLVWVGKAPGKGQAMKTVNQLLCGVHIAAAGEALALAGQLDLDQEVVLEALMAGAAESFMLGDRGPRAILASRGESPEVKSRLDIFVKDMGIVTAAAKAAGMAVPVAAAAEQEYLLGFAKGQGAMDDSSVINVVAPEVK
ncbi:NAD(P)-dependent oxidoreductase [Varibaculum massiliense]|uniref:NAD(P)-dependent oxidoreductase n=1 Tax=Varibaculum massiliense TaxID=1852372 RepID=UPI00288B54C4|nr:NAD(P)-dependent oxidoreductase [Varibaculum massiliense]